MLKYLTTPPVYVAQPSERVENLRDRLAAEGWLASEPIVPNTVDCWIPDQATGGVAGQRLTTAEMIMLANLAPSEPVVIERVVAEVCERITPDGIDRLLVLIAEELAPAPAQPAADVVADDWLPEPLDG